MPESRAFDIIYDGWKEYREKIKGWRTTPPKCDIENWEVYKHMILERLEAKQSGKELPKL